jgi:hypothetical protein
MGEPLKTRFGILRRDRLFLTVLATGACCALAVAGMTLALLPFVPG